MPGAAYGGERRREEGGEGEWANFFHRVRDLEGGGEGVKLIDCRMEKSG
jgi:hypothetical protein